MKTERHMDVAVGAGPGSSAATGAIAGSALGLTLGVAGGSIVQGIDDALLAAMGVLFGAFNGGLLGLVTHFRGR